MKTQIYFEMRKIFGRKFNVVVMLTGYILILICAVNYIREESFYDETTQSYIYGIEAFRMSEEKNRELTDYLTEEYLTKLTEEIQEKNMNMDSDEAYLQVIRPKLDILHVLCSNYMEMGYYVDWNKLNEISTEGGIGFYERRMEKVEEYLNKDFSYGNYSQEEKAFWLKKEQEVQTPFQWGDKSAMDTVWIIIQIAFYLMFVLAVCISPVFASEYESGAATLLLTTKYGKTKLIWAKISAAVLFSLGYVAIGIGMGIAIEGIAVGFQGAELPVQLWGTIIPYNWTIGKTCVVSFAMVLLLAGAFTLFTMFVSARIKGSLMTLVIGFAVLIGPAFLPMSKESGLWNHMNYLFPVRVALTKDVISTLNSYRFGPVVLSYLGMAVLVYAVVGIISLLGIGKGFARHQVR